MYTQENLSYFASLELPLVYLEDKKALNLFYRWCRNNLTPEFISGVSQGLDLRVTANRLIVAVELAKRLSKPSETNPEVKPETNPEVKPETNPEVKPETNPESNCIRLLSRAIALLPPVPPTNGLEETDTYKLLGSPVYFDELVRNYKAIARALHPDVNPSKEAQDIFSTVTSLYRTLSKEWFTKYSPLIPLSKLGEKNLEKAREKTYNFTLDYLWKTSTNL